MKKKLLAAAVAATLGHGVAQAANINPNGLGQVLLYPYFTVQGGHATLISVTNTTDRVKAVKVRFLEASNSLEVLDFNLYLSPNDIWTAHISDDGAGAKLTTNDTSCTVPQIPGIENNPPAGSVSFKSLLVGGDESREQQGYIEILEMGELVGHPLADDATHVSGTVRRPANCAALSAEWLDGTFTPGISPPGGGLYGEAHLVNVTEGKDYPYDAIAIDGFSNTSLHRAPGDTQPNLGDATPAISYVFNGQSVVSTLWQPVPGRAIAPGYDAVSALFMHKAVMNDYVREASVAARTDLVITHPTKREYVNVASGNDADAINPFTRAYKTNKGACEKVVYTVYDREEDSEAAELAFSPVGDAEPQEICWEANVVAVDGASVLDAVDNLGTIGGVPFESGWVIGEFVDEANNNNFGHFMIGEGITQDVNGNIVATGDKHNYFGLPAIGFTVQFYKNLSAEPGKKAEYGALFQNKAVGPFAVEGLNRKRSVAAKHVGGISHTGNPVAAFGNDKGGIPISNGTGQGQFAPGTILSSGS